MRYCMVMGYPCEMLYFQYPFHDMWQTMPTKLIVLLLLLLLLHCHLGKGQTDTDARTLRNELFVNQSYDKRIRPVSDHTLPIRKYILLLLILHHYIIIISSSSSSSSKIAPFSQFSHH